MISFFDTIYTRITGKNKFSSLLRFTIRESFDLLIPFYFKLLPSGVNRLPVKSENRVIISLTTFPQRIGRLWRVIECLLRQSVLPNQIILYLAKSQFQGELEDIPQNLLKYKNLGLLSIIFVDEDIRSHKKYYYALKEFPNDLIITVDDDIYYANNIVKDLIDLHNEYPNSICCLRGYEVLKKDGHILPYKQWAILYEKCGPLFSIFHTSGGGTLYKKDFFTDEVFNMDIFMSHCSQADDIWLNVMAQLSRTQTVRGSYYSNLLPVKSKSFALSTQNVASGGNDRQLRKLIDMYRVNECDIFE